MSSPFYNGFAGVLWQAVYKTLQFYNTNLAGLLAGTTTVTVPATTSGPTAASTSANPGAQPATTNAQAAFLSEVMAQTLYNAAELLNLQGLAAAWAQEVINLEGIAALGLTLDATTQAIFTARLVAYQNAAQALSALIQYAPYRAADVILTGTPVIPYPGLLEFFENFSFEANPAGLSVNTIITAALSIQTAFTTIAGAIAIFQGQNITQLYDVAIREANAAGQAALWLENIPAVMVITTPLPGSNTLQELWNQAASLPAMLMVGESLATAPYLSANQQNAVLRNAMLTLATKIAAAIVVLDTPITQQQFATTTLRNGESLMDVAARTTGNFEDWTEIAGLNNLVPPYTAQVGSPGVAGWGATLLIPTAGLTQSPTGTPPDYERDFLGVDLYTGPLNGSMPPWNGDFQTIIGYGNYAWALGRRLQTTQGTLIYHNLYGSRIPPEVGNVQTTQTGGHILAYGKTALQSDPRTARIETAQVQIGANGAIFFSATVQPGGFTNTPVTINEVI